MTDSENEIPQKRSIKPGRWVFWAAVVMFFIAVGILGVRFYWFHSAVNVLETRYGAVIRGSGPRWLDDLDLVSEKEKLYFSEDILVSVSTNPLVTTPIDLREFIPYLYQLDNLYALQLDRTNIHTGDNGLPYLVDFDHLTLLDISGADISDHGLRHLSRLKTLKSLTLDDCRISDEGIRHLETLKRLEVLSLDGTDITDDGLKHLKSLKNLKHLSLSNTGITDEGCAELLKAIPDLEILDD